MCMWRSHRAKLVLEEAGELTEERAGVRQVADKLRRGHLLEGDQHLHVRMCACMYACVCACVHVCMGGRRARQAPAA